VVTAVPSGAVPTSEMGVEFSTLARIWFTISSSPDRHTLVTRARSGPRCRPGSGFDSADVTVAWTRPSVCSLTSRHRFRRLSTFCAWTGSLCVGVASAVPSGWVQRAFAPGLAHMMSSGSGPARFDEKGTLKDRLTCVPGGITGGALVAVEGRLIGAVTGMSWLVLENGKPAEGAIFSQPCRAWPVKLVILCIVVSTTRAPDGVRAAVLGEEGRGSSERCSVRIRALGPPGTRFSPRTLN
jgi:hypothetical protein